MRRIALLVAVLAMIPSPARADVHSVVRRLPAAAGRIAVYWDGHPGAHVRVDVGQRRLLDVGRDEMGAQRHDGRTYGAVLVVPTTKTVRILSDQRIKTFAVVGLDGPVARILKKLVPPSADTPAPRPAIISRADWGADESLRYRNGQERWTPTFHPIQKLIVHHTDTANNDPNPAATVRAIYRYHALTQGWGDIGYNFVIDQQGRIYKGRNSHAPGSNDDTITGQNANGEGVTGAHARGYNAGSVGVSLLGTLTNQDATPVQKRALEDLLAWEADAQGIDPRGAAAGYPNIAGHRDVGDTQCPGGAFYATLPQVRDAVAARM